MKLHPYFHVKDNKLYVKKGKNLVEVKPTNRQAHEKNLKGAGLWNWVKKKIK